MAADHASSENNHASRKVTDNNYGSRGASVNPEMELDTNRRRSDTCSRSPVLHWPRNSTAPAITPTAIPVPPAMVSSRPAIGRQRTATDGSTTHGTLHHAARRLATARPCTPSPAPHGVHLGDNLCYHYQARRPKNLTIRQASEAIDALKATGLGAEAGS